MIRPHVSFTGRSRRACEAFTLIELLTVIAIILVLAGILINVAGNAQYKSSVRKAQTEIQAISTALEAYKSDNGTYPRVQPASTAADGTGGKSYSDLLNAQTDVDPTSNASKANYQGATETLYQALSGIQPANGVAAFNGTTPNYGGKRYMEFRPGQLMDSSNTAYTSPLATTMIVDPFGFPYGYSTANQAAQDAANAQTPPGTVDTTKGYNPTFDLWSTAGYAPSGGGKQYPTDPGTGTIAVGKGCAQFWAKNW